jgi:hypothetical protein
LFTGDLISLSLFDNRLMLLNTDSLTFDSRAARAGLAERFVVAGGQNLA